MNISRRAAASGVAALIPLGLLGACSQSSTGSTTTLQVTLAGAQAEAEAILSAAETALANVASAAPYLSAASAAVTAFENATANWQSIAEAVVQALAAVIPLLDLSGPAGIAVTLGITFIEALINNIGTLTVPTSVTQPTAPALLPRVSPAAPIVIPPLRPNKAA